jgi:hypothetical protein
MKRFKRFSSVAIFALLGVLTLSTAALQAQNADPFVGKWQLDPEKSQFTPSPGPDERNMVIELTKDGGFHHTVFTPTVFAGVNFIEYTAKFDGKDYEINGSGLDTVSLKRVDQNTIERVGKQGGKQAETCTLKLSADQKILTMTTKGAFNGNNYSSVQVYVRQ